MKTVCLAFDLHENSLSCVWFALHAGLPDKRKQTILGSRWVAGGG
jgi:hypothetical protein